MAAEEGALRYRPFACLANGPQTESSRFYGVASANGALFLACGPVAYSGRRRGYGGNFVVAAYSQVCRVYGASRLQGGSLKSVFFLAVCAPSNIAVVAKRFLMPDHYAAKIVQWYDIVAAEFAGVLGKNKAMPPSIRPTYRQYYSADSLFFVNTKTGSDIMVRAQGRNEVARGD